MWQLARARRVGRLLRFERYAARPVFVLLLVLAAVLPELLSGARVAELLA